MKPQSKGVDSDPVSSPRGNRHITGEEGAGVSHPRPRWALTNAQAQVINNRPTISNCLLLSAISPPGSTMPCWEAICMPIIARCSLTWATGGRAPVDFPCDLPGLRLCLTLAQSNPFSKAHPRQQMRAHPCRYARQGARDW